MEKAGVLRFPATSEERTIGGQASGRAISSLAGV
jgi:hypothetical protein